jgi:hypothetical protein
MGFFYLYVFLLCIFIILISYYNTVNSREGYSGYNQNMGTNRSIILLGDSIFKNNIYTSNGIGVDDILIERTNGNSYCYAEDNSKIVDIYNQINNIPMNLNNPNSTIFLSSGGNDL